MGHPDDYQDEMERLSPQIADEVLSGHRPAGAAAGAAVTAVDRVRQALLVQPAPEVAERHLGAMRAAAGSRPAIHGGYDMHQRNRKRFATLGLAATLVLGAGIAAALTLPDTASDQAREQTADIEPPVAKGSGDQGENGSIQSQTASEHGEAVSALAQDDSLEGCEKGRAVSDLASSKADDNRNNEGDRPGACGPNGGQANGATAPANQGANGNHGRGDIGRNAEAQSLGGSGKSGKSQDTEITSDQQLESEQGQGKGGPPETRGASAGHAKSDG